MKRFFIMLLMVLIICLTGVTWGADATLRSGYNVKQWYYTEAIADTVAGSIVKIPALPAGAEISVALICGANTGTVYFTHSTDALVAADIAGGVKTNAAWIEWDKGTVTGSESDTYVGKITGVYGKSVSGAISIQVRY